MPKMTRPDLALAVVAGLALVGIVVLAALRVPVPDVLPAVAIGALTGGAGVAFSGSASPASTAAAGRIADALASLEQLVADVRGTRSAAPVAPAGVPAQPAPVPAAAGA